MVEARAIARQRLAGPRSRGVDGRGQAAESFDAALSAGASNDAVVAGIAAHLGRIDAIGVIAPKRIALISGYQRLPAGQGDAALNGSRGHRSNRISSSDSDTACSRLGVSG